jgi:exonuclease SbcC
VKRIDQDIAAVDVKINEDKYAVLQMFKKYEPNASGERYKALYETDDVSGQLRSQAKTALDAAAAKAADIEAQIAAALAQQGEAHWRARLERLKKALPVADAADALKTAQQQLAAFKKQQAALEKEQAAFEQPLKDIEEEYEYARLGRRFGEERRKLEDGKPCPLCGALHHPESGNALDESYFDSAKLKFDEAQQNKDSITRRLREIELRIGDLSKQIDEKSVYIDENKALLAELEGEHEAEVIGKAIEDAENRLRNFSILQSSRIAAAENVREMTAQFGDVDKDVAMIDSRKHGIADAQIDKKTKEQLRTQAQAQLDALTAQRRTLFGDKSADAEEAAANKEWQLAQAAKEETRKRVEQAERLWIQNGKDIARAQGELGTRSSQLHIDYEKTAADAANLHNVSDDDDVTALYGRFMDEAATLTAQPEADALYKSIKALEGFIDGEKKQKTIVEIILKNNAGDRQKLKLLKAQEKTCKQKLEKWERLNALIGSASGDKFSRMAQSITFDAMLRYANISLMRMSDRYVLVRDETGPLKPLELAVIDTYQAGDKRPVSNLSGGESFIVSMALALGLSEMSSGVARIDSLFIDEGFASLDEDYMEAALQTLSALGNREGKLIGVISHVEALKNRIDVQIEVRRRSGGCSEVSGPGVKYG